MNLPGNRIEIPRQSKGASRTIRMNFPGNREKLPRSIGETSQAARDELPGQSGWASRAIRAAGRPPPGRRRRGRELPCGAGLPACGKQVIIGAGQSRAWGAWCSLSGCGRPPGRLWPSLPEMLSGSGRPRILRARGTACSAKGELLSPCFPIPCSLSPF